MSSDTLNEPQALEAAVGSVRLAGRGFSVTRIALGLVGIVLVWAAWQVSGGKIYKAGTGFGYFIGVTGAVMMLLMLLYPIRKHMQFARNWGPVRYWFMVHMVFGIGGPLLIVFHSTFHVKSLNAGVSFFSMLLVAFSGIIGRFIYKHIHHGLYGRKSNLMELQQSVDISQKKVSTESTVLIEATGISEKLKQFRDAVITQKGASSIGAWEFIMMGWHRRQLATQCSEELKGAVVRLAESQGWDQKQQGQHEQLVAMQVSDYLRAVQQAAQFTTYERLFRSWHILHTPFVWLLAISAIVHVIAVNMY